MLIIMHYRLIVLLSFLLTTSSFAQESDPLRHYVLEDSVLIVANRYSIPLSRETNTIETLDGADIRRLASHSLLEVLQWQVPSAYVTQTRLAGFGVGSYGTGAVTLRGMGGKPNTGIAVMVDGHPDFMGIFGHPLPDVYGMDDIERVDVVLGPASTVFGSSALGGVVNIVGSPARRNLLRVAMEGGTFGTYSGSLNVSRILGSHGVQLTLGRSATDGHVEQTDFRASRIQAGWDWMINPNWQLSLRSRYVPSRFDDPTRTSDPAGLGTWGDIRRGMGHITLKNSTDELAGSTQVYFNAGHHEFADGFVSDDRTYGVSTYQQWKAGERFSIATGGDMIRFGGESNVNNTDYELSSAGVYALGMYSPLSKVHLRAGLRYQYHSIGLASFAPSAGVSITPISGLRVYANAQSGFRHPSVRELYLFPPSNPDLKEERSVGYEAGTEYVIRHASLRVSVFRNDIRDMIATVANPTPPPPIRFLNSDEATLTGIEASLRVRIIPYLQAQLAWSSLDPDQLTAFNPEQQFKYAIFGKLRSVRFTLAGQYVHKLFAGNDATLKLPDYHILDFTISWETPWAELHVKAHNLLNREYYVLPNYRAPGAYVLTGITLTFGD